MQIESSSEARELERQLALALDSARMVAWTWDPKLDRVETSGDLAAIYGLPAVDYAEKGFSLIHPDDVAAHRERVSQAVASGAAYRSEFRIIRPDNGQIVWIEERAQPILDASGALLKLSGVVKDITEHKREEAILDDAKTLLGLTFANLDQAVFVIEPDTRKIISANAAVEHVFGYRPEALFGRTTELFYADHDRYAAVGEQLFASLDARGAFHTELEMVRKDGAPFYAEVSVSEIRASDGRRSGLVSVIRDISARQQAAQALQAAKVDAEEAAYRTALLQRVTGALTPLLQAAEVTQVIVDQSAAALGASASAIYLIEPAGQWLNLRASIGYPSVVLEAVRRLPVSAGLPGPDVFRAREPMWLRSNAELVDRYPALASTRSATRNEALAVIPLLIDERALGVLALSFSEPRPFEPAEREVLQTLARQCAQALDRNRLYESEQQARQLAERTADRLARLQRVTALVAVAGTASEVAQVVVGQGAAGFGTPSGAIYRLRPEGTELEMAGSYAVAPESAARYVRLPLAADLPAAEAVRSRQPQFFSSRANLAALYPAFGETRNPQNVAHASIPLLLGEEVIGVVTFSLREEHEFDQEEQLFLMALGRQAAQALERIRLYDIEQQSHTAQLHNIETRFRALVNSVQDYAIFMLDPDGRVANWNTGAVRIKGYHADEIIGQHFSRFYTPEDAEKGVPQRGLAAALNAGRYEAEGWRVRKDGRLFWANVVITPVYGDAGELIGFAKVTRDLTERRKADEQYRQSERQLAEAQHMAHLGSWHWDVAANLVTWSDEMYRIYGLKPRAEDVTYESFLAFVHPGDREMVQANISRSLLDHKPFAFDHRIIRADGAERTLQAHGEPMVDSEGRLTAIAGTGQDITERKEIEYQLQSSRERLRQLSAHLEVAREEERARMAREIHDELGGMLTGLKMDVSQMRRGSPALDPPARSKLEDFSLAIDLAVQTVRRIASDLRPAVLDDFGLIAAMEWQLGEFQRRSGIACSWQSGLRAVDLPREDMTAVFRIFQESLTNVARHAQATQVQVLVEGDTDHLVLQIRDNGLGITPEQSQGSQSLGLAGMRERVSLLAGEILIEGDPGQGTNVLVRIPLAPPAGQAHAGAAHHPDGLR
jgi:PAS domain S-box-containing protein